MFVER